MKDTEDIIFAIEFQPDIIHEVCVWLGSLRLLIPGIEVSDKGCLIVDDYLRPEEELFGAFLNSDWGSSWVIYEGKNYLMRYSVVTSLSLSDVRLMIETTKEKLKETVEALFQVKVKEVEWRH